MKAFVYCASPLRTVSKSSKYFWNLQLSFGPLPQASLRPCAALSAPLNTHSRFQGTVVGRYLPVQAIPKTVIVVGVHGLLVLHCLQ